MNTVERLRAVLETCDGPVTRAWLEAKCNELDPPTSKRAKLANDREPVAPVRLEPTASDDRELVDTTGSRESISASNSALTVPAPAVKASALLITPSKKDLSRLKEDYMKKGEPFCLGFSSETVTADVIVAILAPVGEVLRLIDKLGSWGADRVLRLYLLAPPSGPNVINADAVAICGRSRSKFFNEPSDWPTETDPVKFAQSLLNEISGRRVHLFANVDTPGWDCRIGNVNWHLGITG